MAERLPQLDPDRREVALMSRAIKACMLATAASRGLDATICAAAFPSLAEMEELEPGTRIDDFDLLARLGRGAFATVFLAHDIFPIALCLAAMRARVIAHEPRAPHQDLPQEQFNV